MVFFVRNKHDIIFPPLSLFPANNVIAESTLVHSVGIEWSPSLTSSCTKIIPNIMLS